MKPPSPIDEQSRFKGSLRHYHRIADQKHRTWDEWVDGKPADERRSVNWLKIGLAIVSLLALAGIVAGLIIELR